MRLGATITSEKGKAMVKTANEVIMITFTSDRRQKFDIIFHGEMIDILKYSTGQTTRTYYTDEENENLKHDNSKDNLFKDSSFEEIYKC